MNKCIGEPSDFGENWDIWGIEINGALFCETVIRVFLWPISYLISYVFRVFNFSKERMEGWKGGKRGRIGKRRGTEGERVSKHTCMDYSLPQMFTRLGGTAELKPRI